MTQYALPVVVLGTTLLFESKMKELQVNPDPAGGSVMDEVLTVLQVSVMRVHDVAPACDVEPTGHARHAEALVPPLLLY